MLQLKLFGQPEIILNGTPLSNSIGGKAQAALYYLAMTGRPQARGTLAGLLWGDVPEALARTSLRKALTNLRQTVGDYLEIERQAVAFNLAAAFKVDVVEFERLVGQIAEASNEQIQAAMTLYQGDFLAGFYVRHAPDFEDWALAEQTRLRELMVQALHTLAARQAERGELTAGIATTRRLLALEPWREEAHQRLMRLLAHDGQRGAALAQFDTCVAVLAEELGVEPSTETTALYERIRDGQLERLAPPPPPAPQPAQPPPPARATTLPAQPTPFIGRQAELADLLRRLTDPNCRLLTLVGPGGSGKTRLVIEAAETILKIQPTEVLFKDGILFVSLTPVNSVSGMIAAIAEAAGFTFYSNVSPHQQLLDFLRVKELLLILDNIEHLLPGAQPNGSGPEPAEQSVVEFVSEILGAAPQVKLLVTSREALNVQQEWFHPVAGMPFPPAESDAVNIERYDSVRLFVESALRARVDFSLMKERQAVVRICQLSEGLPLAIELAATWLKMMPAAKIVREIERGLDIFSTRLQDIPARHRSIRVVFEHSWQLLGQTERAVLKRLAVFHGDFDLEAAEAIAGASIVTLAALVEKSLLKVTQEGRYHLHELLRQFSGEKLVADPAAIETTHTRHSRYYLKFLEAHAQQLLGAEQQHALNRIGLEIENMRAGWHWAVAQQQFSALAGAITAFYQFFQNRSRYQEGQEVFSEAVRHWPQAVKPSAETQSELIYARLLARLGAFHFFLSDYDAAERHLQSSLATARRLEQPAEVAFTLNILGQMAGWQGQPAQAKEALQTSLTVSRELNDRSQTANSLHKLAQICCGFGDYLEGKQLAEECLVISRELGRRDLSAQALDVLGWATVCLGEYDAAEAYYQASLAASAEIEDRFGMAMALGGIGSVAWARGPATMAHGHELFEQSLALCRAIGHRQQVSSRLWYLAQIAYDRGDYEAAQRYGQEGFAVASALGNSVFTPYSLSILGATATALGQFAAGRTYLRDALKLASAVAQRAVLPIALLYYADLLLKESLTLAEPDAESHQRQALKLLALIRQHPATWQPYKERAAQLQSEFAAGVSLDRADSLTLEAAVADILPE